VFAYVNIGHLKVKLALAAYVVTEYIQLEKLQHAIICSPS